MIKRIKQILLIFVLATLLIGCNKDEVREVNISLTNQSINLTVGNTLNHDFTKYFIITENGQIINTSKDYLDTSSVKDSEGTYIVTCLYEKKIASLIVNVTKPKNVTIIPEKGPVSLTNLTVSNHDFTKYFTIIEDNKEVEVKSEFIDSSNVKKTEGTYKVVCTYKGVTSEILVNVSEVNYQIKISQTEVTLKQSDVATHDFKKYFTVVVEGKIQTITDDMIISNVSSEIGTYTYKVKLGETLMTLNVSVVSDHDVEIINSYELFEIEQKDLETFDFTKLFTVYVDKEIRNITADVIDKSSLNNPSSDNIYTIKITYTENKAVGQSECKIKVVPTIQAQIKAKNITTYPNGDYIDLTSLFEIVDGGKTVKVTPNMVSGKIDYSKVGDNIITLTYENQTAQAVVSVVKGVVINSVNGDLIEVKKNTDINKYDFNKDFSVIINGIKFNDINSYIDKENIDFSEVGTYDVTLKIPYTDSSLGISKDTLFTKTIKYKVVETTYDLKVLNSYVVLPKQTTSYNVFDNLSLKVNGVNQKLVKSQLQVSQLAKYAEVLTEIDFTNIGVQTIEVKVYITNDMPVVVSFDLIIESNINITCNNQILFDQKTIYTKDLFEITYNDEAIEVTQDMIEGYVDVFTPGRYDVTINYLGIKKTATVIVLNKDIVGVYKTDLKTIKKESTEDEEGYVDEVSQQSVLKDLHITSDGVISVNGALAQVIGAIDENTLIIKVGSTEYKLYHQDSIVLLDPNNDIKLQYNDAKRPMIYFNSEKYELGKHIVINSTSNYVLNSSYQSYSFDIFELTSKQSNETMWYALKVYLYEKTSNDTNYIVSIGEVTFDSNYTFSVDEVSSFTYLNEKYPFSLQSKTTGSIKKTDISSLYKYTNMTFSGLYEGQNATIYIDEYEGISLSVGNNIIIKVGGATIRSQKYGGYDYENDILYLSTNGLKNELGISAYITFDLENNTFTIDEKDRYFGKYQSSKMELFLDGYGKGIINFDISQFGTTAFTYQVLGSDIIITYIDITPSFTNGTTATFNMDALYNTLTLRYMDVEVFDKDILTNTNITKGAIISINDFVMEKQSSVALGRKALFDKIQILTKDGYITSNAEKIKIVDISDVDFAKCGFYHFFIKINVDGEDVIMDYALQII